MSRPDANLSGRCQPMRQKEAPAANPLHKSCRRARHAAKPQDVHDIDARSRDKEESKRTRPLGRHYNGRFGRSNRLAWSRVRRIPGPLCRLEIPAISENYEGAYLMSCAPGLNLVTPSPTLITTPELSWPSPFSPTTTMSPTWPCFQKCTSEPQMPVARTCTRQSFGPGSGMSL